MINCLNCKIIFNPVNKKQKCCSKYCNENLLRHKSKCKQCGFEKYHSRPKTKNWLCHSCACVNKKGNKSWIDSRGYEQQYCLRDRKVKGKHRIVWEKFTGETLLPEEEIHHIDFDKLNNNMENFVKFSNHSEHKLAELSLYKIVKKLIKKDMIFYDRKTNTYQIKK